MGWWGIAKRIEYSKFKICFSFHSPGGNHGCHRTVDCNKQIPAMQYAHTSNITRLSRLWAPPWADTKGTRDVLVSVLLSRACNVCGTDCINCVRTYDVHNRTNSGAIHSPFTCVTTSHEQHAVDSLTLGHMTYGLQQHDASGNTNSGKCSASCRRMTFVSP